MTVNNMFIKKLKKEIIAFIETLGFTDVKYAESENFLAEITHWTQNQDHRPPLMSESFYQFLQNNRLIILKKLETLLNVNFMPVANPFFSFIDLFAGIGGFRIAMQELGGKCVFSSEWDKYSQETYAHNFGEIPYGDINLLASQDMSNEEIASLIPDHDILCAGFPCQPFSLAGVSKKNSMGRKHGFEDETQGTLFFNIVRIIESKQPRAFFLENVKNILTHDKKKTFKVIEKKLTELGYVFTWKVVDGSKWVPQHRERIFIVGFNPNSVDILKEDIKIPTDPSNDYHYTALNQIIQENIEGYTLGPGTWRTLVRHKAYHKKKGNGFGYGIHAIPISDSAITRTISARYHKDGAEILIEQPNRRPRRLTIDEAKQLQGYPVDYEFPVSKTQSYKQIGNSVVVPAIKESGRMIVDIIVKEQQ